MKRWYTCVTQYLLYAQLESASHQLKVRRKIYATLKQEVHPTQNVFIHSLLTSTFKVHTPSMKIYEHVWNL